MSFGTILIIVLLLALAGALPSWPHSRRWGFAPAGTLGVIVVALLVLMVFEKF